MLTDCHPQPQPLPTPTHLLNGKIQRGIASTHPTNFFNFGVGCASGASVGGVC